MYGRKGHEVGFLSRGNGCLCLEPAASYKALLSIPALHIFENFTLQHTAQSGSRGVSFGRRLASFSDADLPELHRVGKNV